MEIIKKMFRALLCMINVVLVMSGIILLVSEAETLADQLKVWGMAAGMIILAVIIGMIIGGKKDE